MNIWFQMVAITSSNHVFDRNKVSICGLYFALRIAISKGHTNKTKLSSLFLLAFTRACPHTRTHRVPPSPPSPTLTHTHARARAQNSILVTVVAIGVKTKTLPGCCSGNPNITACCVHTMPSTLHVSPRPSLMAHSTERSKPVLCSKTIATMTGTSKNLECPIILPTQEQANIA